MNSHSHTHTPLLCRYAICPFASCKHPGIAVKATELMPDTRTDPRNNLYPKQAWHEPRIPQSNCYYRLLEPALLKRRHCQHGQHGHWLGNVLQNPALFAAFGWYIVNCLHSIEINVARVHASLQLHLRFITSIHSAGAWHDNVDAPCKHKASWLVGCQAAGKAP